MLKLNNHLRFNIQLNVEALRLQFWNVLGSKRHNIFYYIIHFEQVPSNIVCFIIILKVGCYWIWFKISINCWGTNTSDICKTYNFRITEKLISHPSIKSTICWHGIGLLFTVKSNIAVLMEERLKKRKQTTWNSGYTCLWHFYNHGTR